METKFTPGKWEIDKLSACSTYIPITTDNPERGWIAEAKGKHVNPGLTDKEMLANAKVIAAAPEMFEVLMTIENDSNQVPDWLWKRIKSVIKKVTA